MRSTNNTPMTKAGISARQTISLLCRFDEPRFWGKGGGVVGFIRLWLMVGRRFVWLKASSSFRKIIVMGTCLRHLPGTVGVQPFHRPQSQHRFVADANGIH